MRDDHIGISLKSRREAAGLSVRDIARELCISPNFVDAIERLDTEALPSIGYVLGYVRSYAALVGLATEQAVSQYKTDTAISPEVTLRDSPHFVPQERMRLPRGFFAALTIMSCFAAAVFWYGSQSEAEGIPAPSSSAVSLDTDQDEPQLAENAYTLKAVGATWIEVKTQGGETVMSRILVPGDVWQTPTASDAVISVRDGGAIEVYLGYRSLGPVGQKGQPVMNVPLREAAERRRTASNQTAPSGAPALAKTVLTQ